jgi:hypothetical protein
MKPHSFFDIIVWSKGGIGKTSMHELRSMQKFTSRRKSANSSVQQIIVTY